MIFDLQAEFHICSTKSLLINYRQYCHIQGRMLRGLMWNAWFTWFTMYRDIQVCTCACVSSTWRTGARSCMRVSPI